MHTKCANTFFRSVFRQQVMDSVLPDPSYVLSHNTILNQLVLSFTAYWTGCSCVNSCPKWFALILPIQHIVRRTTWYIGPNRPKPIYIFSLFSVVFLSFCLFYRDSVTIGHTAQWTLHLSTQSYTTTTSISPFGYTKPIPYILYSLGMVVHRKRAKARIMCLYSSVRV